jgi:hypothetical protein
MCWLIPGCWFVVLIGVSCGTVVADEALVKGLSEPIRVFVAGAEQIRLVRFSLEWLLP